MPKINQLKPLKPISLIVSYNLGIDKIDTLESPVLEDSII
jgi:hypothetical protein